MSFLIVLNCRIFGDFRAVLARARDVLFKVTIHSKITPNCRLAACYNKNIVMPDPDQPARFSNLSHSVMTDPDQASLCECKNGAVFDRAI